MAFHRSSMVPAPMHREFGEGHLDRVEIRAVRWEVCQILQTPAPQTDPNLRAPKADGCGT